MYIANGAVLLIYFLLRLCKQTTGIIAKLRAKLRNYFFWNGLQRFFMETFFELVLSAAINAKTADWETSFPSEKYSNALSVIVLAIICVLLLVLPIFYICNFSALQFDRFGDTYGGVLEGTRYKDHKPSRSILFYPLTFFIRRLLFVWNVLYLDDFLWAQLAIQTYTSIFILAYLLS